MQTNGRKEPVLSILLSSVIIFSVFATIYHEDEQRLQPLLSTIIASPVNSASNSSESNIYRDVATIATTATKEDTAPPTVVSTVPPDGATGVPFDQVISATFGEAVRIPPNSFTITDPAGNKIPGNMTVSTDNRTTSFDPANLLTANTRYKATVGAWDQAGHALENNVWSFVTSDDTTPPTVVSTDPVPDATGVARDKVITATFSEAVRPPFITTSTFYLRDPAFNPLPASISVSPDGKIAALRPSSLLAANTRYTAVITTEVKDLAGNPIIRNKVWPFTTEEIATQLQVNPIPATLDLYPFP